MRGRDLDMLEHPKGHRVPLGEWLLEVLGLGRFVTVPGPASAF